MNQNYGNLLLVLSENINFSEKSLNGNILLHLKKPFPALQLDLKLKVYEYCSWEQLKNNENKLKGQNLHEKIYCSQIITIQTWKKGGNLPIENRLFPFEINLNNNWPSSFLLKNQQISAHTTYKLKCTLVSYDQNIQSLKYSKNIDIVKGLIEKNDFKFNLPVKAMCCLNKGNIKLCIKPLKPVFIKEENINFDIELFSNNIKINRVNVILIQNLIVSGKWNDCWPASSEREKIFLNQNYDDIAEKNHLIKINYSIKDNENIIFLSSTEGEINKCSYKIIIKLFLQKRLCASNIPSIEQYFHVIAPINTEIEKINKSEYVEHKINVISFNKNEDSFLKNNEIIKPKQIEIQDKSSLSSEQEKEEIKNNDIIFNNDYPWLPYDFHWQTSEVKNNYLEKLIL